MGSLERAFDSGGLGATVGGVAFATGCGAGDDVCDAIGSAAFGQFDDNAVLGDLDTLLRTANYTVFPANTSPTTVSLTGLVSGIQYQLQLFFMDQRGSPSSPPAGCVGCNDRQVTFTSGLNSVTLEADALNTLGAAFDQFGTPISLRQVNAWQLRAVSEPSAIVLLAFVVPALKRRLRYARI